MEVVAGVPDEAVTIVWRRGGWVKTAVAVIHAASTVVGGAVGSARGKFQVGIGAANGGDVPRRHNPGTAVELVFEHPGTVGIAVPACRKCPATVAGHRALGEQHQPRF